MALAPLFHPTRSLFFVFDFVASVLGDGWAWLGFPPPTPDPSEDATAQLQKSDRSNVRCDYRPARSVVFLAGTCQLRRGSYRLTTFSRIAHEPQTLATHPQRKNRAANSTKPMHSTGQERYSPPGTLLPAALLVPLGIQGFLFWGPLPACSIT